MLKELFLLSASVMLGLAADATAFGAEVNGGREMYLQYCGSCHVSLQPNEKRNMSATTEILENIGANSNGRETRVA